MKNSWCKKWCRKRCRKKDVNHWQSVQVQEKGVRSRKKRKATRMDVTAYECLDADYFG